MVVTRAGLLLTLMSPFLALAPFFQPVRSIRPAAARDPPFSWVYATLRAPVILASASLSFIMDVVIELAKRVSGRQLGWMERVSSWSFSWFASPSEWFLSWLKPNM